MNRILPIAALAAALLPASAAAQNRAEIQMAAELRILQQQQAQLSLDVAKLSQALADAMKALNSRLDGTNSAITKEFANQALVLRELGNNVGVILARSQDTGTRLGEIREEIEALRTSVTALAARPTIAAPPPVDPLAPLDPNAPPAVPVDTPPVQVPPLNTGVSPQQTFNTALSDYAAGQFTAAIAGFDSYIKQFPTFERADDAQQYIGDAHRAEMRLNDALNAYNLVIQNYPMGDQVPWAYYKRGLVLRSLKRLEEARASLERATKFPNNEVAGLASQVLVGVNAELAAKPAQKP